jgi:hypothetical protein
LKDWLNGISIIHIKCMDNNGSQIFCFLWIPNNMQVTSFALYKKFVNSSSFIHVHPPLIDHIAQRPLFSLLGVNLYIFSGWNGISTAITNFDFRLLVNCFLIVSDNIWYKKEIIVIRFRIISWNLSRFQVRLFSVISSLIFLSING